MTVWSWAVAAWVAVGALVVASRDPVGFARFFWGALAIVLWPLALVAGRLVDRRDVKAADRPGGETSS